MISEHDTYLFNRNQRVHSLHVTGGQEIQGSLTAKNHCKRKCDDATARQQEDEVGVDNNETIRKPKYAK